MSAPQQLKPMLHRCDLDQCVSRLASCPVYGQASLVWAPRMTMSDVLSENRWNSSSAPQRDHEIGRAHV